MSTIQTSRLGDHLDRRILVVTLVTAFCSMCYELLVAQTMVSLRGNAGLWYSLTIGVYLVGLGIGSAVASKVPTARARPTLVVVELGLSLLGAATPLLLYVIRVGLELAVAEYDWSRSQDSMETVGLFSVGASQSVALALGVLSGFEIPLLGVLLSKQKSTGEIDPLEPNEATASNSYALLLALGYFGGLLGAVGFGLILTPALGNFQTANLIGLLNLLAAIALIPTFSMVTPTAPLTRRGRLMSFAAATAIILVLLWSFGEPLSAHLRRLHYAGRAGLPAVTGFAAVAGLAALPRVEHRRSTYQSIDLVFYQNREYERDVYRLFNPAVDIEPGPPAGMAFFLDRHKQFYSLHERIYHEYLVQAPMLLLERIPQNVLVLGGGDGMVARELLRHGDGIAAITQVELDPAVIELANTHPELLKLNGGALQDPKVELIIGDAFTFARQSSRKFDAIIADLPFPDTPELAKLYSLEFYRALIQRLAPRGYIIADVPMSAVFNAHKRAPPDIPASYLDRHGVPFPNNDKLLSTMIAAGFETIFPYSHILGRPSAPQRRALLTQFADHPLESAASALLTTLEDTNIHQSYVLLCPTRCELSVQRPRAPQPFPVGLTVLTPARRALLGKQEFIFYFDSAYVNSVLKPTFPDPSLAHLF